MTTALGLVSIQTNNDLRKEEEAERQAQQAARERQAQPALVGLAHVIRMLWNAAKTAKSNIEQDMLVDLRNRRGEYSQDKLAEIRKQGGSEIFMMLGEEKASAITAWLKDIYFGNANSKIWGTKTTPVPELNPAQKAKIITKVVQEAQGEMRAMVEAELLAGRITEAQASERLAVAMMERMEELAGEIQEAEQASANKAEARIESKLEDVMVESEFNKVLGLIIDDLNTYKSIVLKGPFQKMKKVLVWNTGQPGQGPMDSPAKIQMGMGMPGGAMGQAIGQAPQLPAPGQQPQQPQRPVTVENKLTWAFERVSPLDIYPLPDAENLQQGFFHRHRLTKSDLYNMRNTRGFDAQAIDLVMREYTDGALDWLNVGIDHQRHTLEDRPDEWRRSGGKIDALQFWGEVQGLQLLQNGMDPMQIEDPLAMYRCEVWLIDKFVIKAELNGDPMGDVPYHKTSFRRNNGSFWGKSSLGLIRDSIDACNATARNMLNNAAISSGPQVGIDYSQIREGDQVTAMYPWKLWAFDGSAPGAMGSQRDPLRFFVPPSTTAELKALYEFFSGQADEKTGVPKYAYGGNDKGGPLNTARGFTMMMNSVARGIKDVIRNIDEDIISPAIVKLYQNQLLYSNDPEWFQSDLKIIAQGSISLVMKEAAALRRNEFLAIAASPLIMKIIGIEGYTEILRAVTEGLDLPSGNIVPTKEAVMRKFKMEELNQIIMAGQGQQNKPRAIPAQDSPQKQEERAE